MHQYKLLSPSRLKIDFMEHAEYTILSLCRVPHSSSYKSIYFKLSFRKPQWKKHKRYSTVPKSLSKQLKNQALCMLK